MASAQEASDNGSTSPVPEPIVKIDNESDPFATVVSVEFGDRLGELLDTVRMTIRRRHMKMAFIEEVLVFLTLRLTVPSRLFS